MYKEFYGLTSYPFAVTPDPHFLYLSENHNHCLLYLLSGLEREYGIMVLTGDVGTGKTLLLHRLVKMLGEETYVAFLVHSNLNPTELLQHAYHEFGLGMPNESKGDLLLCLKDFIRKHPGSKSKFVIIIDEAQNLSADVLEELRLLTNFETSEKKLIQIILSGQPNLEKLLQDRELDQLRQRIGIHCHLTPMNFDETREYIEKRLSVAGATHTLFTPEAIQAIFAHAQGIPRVINLLCDLALFSGYTERTCEIGPATVKRVAEHLNVSGPADPARPSMGPQHNAPGAAAGSDSVSSPETAAAASAAPFSSPASPEPSGRRPSQRAIFEHLISQKMQEQEQIGKRLSQRQRRSRHPRALHAGMAIVGLLGAGIILPGLLPSGNLREYITRAGPPGAVAILPPDPGSRELPLLPQSPGYREPPLLPQNPGYRTPAQQVQWSQTTISYQLPVGKPFTVPLPQLSPATDQVSVTIALEGAASIPMWLNFDPATLALSGTAPLTETGKTYHFTLRAHTADGLASLLQLVVTLIAHAKP